MTFLYSRITLRSRYLEANFEKLENLSKFMFFAFFSKSKKKKKKKKKKNGVSHVLALTTSCAKPMSNYAIFVTKNYNSF